MNTLSLKMRLWIVIAITLLGISAFQPLSSPKQFATYGWVCHEVTWSYEGEGLYTVTATGGANWWQIVDSNKNVVAKPQTDSKFTNVPLTPGEYQVQAADGEHGPWTQQSCTFTIPQPPVEHDYSYKVDLTTACEPPKYTISITGPEVVAQTLSGDLTKEVQTISFTVHFTDGTTKDDTQKVPAFDAEECGGTTTTTHDAPKSNTPGMIYCEWSTPLDAELKFWVYWVSGNGMFHNVVDQTESSVIGAIGKEFGTANVKEGRTGRTITFTGFAHMLLGGTFTIWIEGIGQFTTFTVDSNNPVFPRESKGWDLTGKCRSSVTSDGGSNGAGEANLLPANPDYAAIRLLVARVTANDDPGMDLYANGFEIIDAYVLAHGKRVENLNFTDSKLYSGWKTGYYTYLPQFGEKAEIVVKFADGTKTFVVTQPIEVVDPTDLHAGNSLMRANFVGSNKDGSVQMKWFPGNSVEELYRRSGFDGTLTEFKKLWNEANPSHSGLDRVLPKSILDLSGSTPATWFQ